MPWTDTTTPLDGNQARGVCWDPDNADFVATGQDLTDLEAIIASADGINWIYRASPLDGGVGYAAARSTPNGVTVVAGTGPDGVSQAIVTAPDNAAWTDRGNPFVGFGAGFGVAVRDSDDAILLAGVDPFNERQLAITTDTGTSWSLAAALSAGGQGRAVAVRASDDLLLLVGTGSTDYAAVSADGGATWARSKPFGVGGACYGCAVRVSDGALVVVGSNSSSVAQMGISTDGGATWTTHAPFGATASGPALGVAVRTGDDAIVVVGFDATQTHQLSYSTDGGSTWTMRSPFGAFGRAAAITILDGFYFYVAGFDFGGVHQEAISINDGVTWTTSQPLGVGGEGTGIALFAGHGGYGVVSGQGPGSPTNQVALGDGPSIVYSPFGDGREAGEIAIRLSDSRIVVAGSPKLDDTGEPTQVAISTDALAPGLTWAVYSPFNRPQGQGAAVGCNQSSGVVLVGSSYSSGYVLARAIDGLSYVPVDTPLNRGGVGGIAYSPSQGRWIIAGQSATVAYSDDDGLTWTVISTHPMDFSFGVVPSVYRDEANGNWYLLGQTTGGHALAVSSDGATWTEIATPLDPVAGVGQANTMVNAGGTLALGGWDSTYANQMCSSFDAGATWVLDASTPAPFGAGGGAYGLAYSDTLPIAVVAGIA